MMDLTNINLGSFEKATMQLAEQGCNANANIGRHCRIKIAVDVQQFETKFVGFPLPLCLAHQLWFAPDHLRLQRRIGDRKMEREF